MAQDLASSTASSMDPRRISIIVLQVSIIVLQVSVVLLGYTAGTQNKTINLLLNVGNEHNKQVRILQNEVNNLSVRISQLEGSTVNVDSRRSDELARLIKPWTPEQVESLNLYQQDKRMHPFICRAASQHGKTKLIATVDGWKCPRCKYRQYWCQDWMADMSWVKDMFD